MDGTRKRCDLITIIIIRIIRIKNNMTAIMTTTKVRINAVVSFRRLNFLYVEGNNL